MVPGARPRTAKEAGMCLQTEQGCFSAVPWGGSETCQLTARQNPPTADSSLGRSPPGQVSQIMESSRLEETF